MSLEPKVNVLLVDDHPENLLALEAILDSLGQNLIRATSGAEALRHLLNQDFAVILLDVQMPDMDGFETASLIRQRERSRHTPIIFLTAYSTSDTMVYRGYSVGAVDYLFKPIEPEILKYKVSAFVDLFQKSNEVKRQAAQLALMNAELRKREEMFRSLSVCSPVGIFLTDTLGKCTYTNPRYQAIYGMTHEESLGDGWTLAIHPQDRQQVIADWYAVSSKGQEYKGEFRILIPSSIERWVLMSSSPMLSNEKQVIGYVGTVEDITERKKAAEEHIKLIREQTARQEAETANRLKDEFLATLSHELRTPLTSILGWARLLRQRKLDEKAIVRALETIERNAALQAQLIDDILDVSRIIRGKLQLNLARVNLASVVSAVIDSVHLEAETKKIQLEYVVESTHSEAAETRGQEDEENDPVQLAVSLRLALSTSYYVLGDPNRIQQIVWNLMNNALKFTPEGGKIQVRLSMEEGRGGLGIGNNSPSLVPNAQSPTYIQITVSDTGNGISPEFLPYVFDRFRQADGSITRNQGGLGLGLAIVRYLVEMHGGSVRAESPGLGQGATFTVRLPLLEGKDTVKKETGGEMEEKKSSIAPTSPNLESKVNSSDPFHTLSGLQVLVVDDDTDTREYVTTVLQQHGATVTAVASVRQALSTIEKSPPDVLVSDIGMPEEDGYTLIDKLRNLEPEIGGQIPAIALTAYVREQDCYRALEYGFQEYVTKPVEPTHLINSVTKLIQRKS
ncbi:hybrid sensor histidine kinase/response regulator [Scytonema hofmannii PCC 7110]|uniref:histidine kinase n=1 Tax=Scytonema hofmannii PCC 7110 TaxID=128403 RepID=A0A139X2Y2_9CYAN|nr:response regulator [Scytonema hofmannii]KYC39055.1 hybrid sensor histidine kinase/response regulator [Scytonema hofmannii PCC 7110]